MTVHTKTSRRPAALMAALMTAMLAALALAGPARAQSVALSQASALSALPVAVVLGTPLLLSAGAAQFTVLSVQATGQGMVWLVERASDGARLSLRVAGGASVAAGTALQVTALSAGWVVSAAGQALAFVPNAVGLALMHHEQVAR